MSSAWLLPEHIADVLPSQARQIEELRRRLLDAARCHGFEMVIPPLLEHVESLLSGTGKRMDLRTFKLVDQLSGRSLGVRADATPQVARIDAHLLNRVGVTRLCYCVPLLRTLPSSVSSSREPLQFGAEIFGHRGIEADLEAIELAIECADQAGLQNITVDLGHAGIVRSLMPHDLSASEQSLIFDALAAKDKSDLKILTRHWPAAQAQALSQLPGWFGSVQEVTSIARSALQDVPQALAALDELIALTSHVQTLVQARAPRSTQVTIDLGDLGGNAYYTGPRFAIYSTGQPAALIRGGRYDAVGSIFGRDRPAVGFGLDLKVLSEAVVVELNPHSAISAPAQKIAGLDEVIRQLRQQGHTVIRQMPGDEPETQEFIFDRQLVNRQGQWMVEPLSVPPTVSSSSFP